MDAHYIWLILALALAGAEMMVGTFYLLLFGVACAAGGVAAWVGLPPAVPYLIATLIAVGGTVWLRKHGFSRHSKTGNSLEVGQTVEVEAWKTPTTARVRYRGCGWDGELAAPLAEPARLLYIVGQRGNTLLLAATPK